MSFCDLLMVTQLGSPRIRIEVLVTNLTPHWLNLMAMPEMKLRRGKWEPTDQIVIQ